MGVLRVNPRSEHLKPLFSLKNSSLCKCAQSRSWELISRKRRENVQNIGKSEFLQSCLDPESFYNLVQNRPVGQLWIVDFYAEWCGPCQRLLPEIRHLARDTKGIIYIGKVDCGDSKNSAFCKRHQINHYPDLRLYPIRQ